jgi:pimeloyl-ACP methyl ester carboxylesterase
LPEKAIVANDFAFIDYLWALWSAPGYTDPAHLVDVKRTLAMPGVLAATLGYYRAMLDPTKGDPALSDLRQRMNRTIAVPTLALCGREDLRAELMMDQSQYFSGEYRFSLVDGAGHFLHREQPEIVNRLMLDFLAHA